MRLPKGYLDMGWAELETLDIPTLRGVYAETRDISRYFMGSDASDKAITDQNPLSPIGWVFAARAVGCRCERCHGTGTYYWGACVNGVMSKSAPCARCAGKGRMTFDDMRRSRAYDNYAIARAVAC
jgi:hypothetical protein